MEKKQIYRQSSRAEAAAKTRDNILEAFEQLLLAGWYDDITLDAVAAVAGVTVPTVLRHFGNKEGILEAAKEKFGEEIGNRRTVVSGDVDAAIRAVIHDYEEVGDLVMRFLAQEPRIPIIKSYNDFGRLEHRTWVQKSFAPYLEGLSDPEREWRIDGIVMSLDIYVWQVLRRERNRTPEEVHLFMKQLVSGFIQPQGSPVQTGE